jgi:hypothetical protein
MTLWDQLGGRTWNRRAGWRQPEDAGPARRRRQARRRKLVQPTRRVRD